MIGVDCVINRYLQRNEERARGTADHASYVDAISDYKIAAQNQFMALANNLHANAIRRIARDTDNSTIAQAIEATARGANDATRGAENAGFFVDVQGNLQRNHVGENQNGSSNESNNESGTETGNESG